MAVTTTVCEPFAETTAGSEAAAPSSSTDTVGAGLPAGRSLAETDSVTAAGKWASSSSVWALARMLTVGGVRSTVTCTVADSLLPFVEVTVAVIAFTPSRSLKSGTRNEPDGSKEIAIGPLLPGPLNVRVFALAGVRIRPLTTVVGRFVDVRSVGAVTITPVAELARVTTI